MTTHALLTPWPLSSGLFTYCGKSCEDAGDDRVANNPEMVDCKRCQEAMRIALVNLERWVPSLPGGE